MNKKDLDALAGLYESVYSPTDSDEYLSEDYIEEQGGRSARPANPALSQNPIAKWIRGESGQNRNTGSSGPRNRPGGGTSSAVRPKIASLPASARQVSQYPAGVPTGVGGGNAGSSTAAKPAAKPAATAPAARPASGGMGGPQGSSVRPATPGSGAKVAPSSAAKPATPAPGTKAAGPDSIKPKTPNPLMQRTFGYQTGNAPDQIKAASAGADPKKAEASFARSKQTANKLGMSGSLKAISSGYEWPSAKTIRDIAGAYASIYEAKKKDQDQDGDKDKDFADVMIARMIASGMSRAEAIAAVRNKEYNEEFVTEDPIQDFRDMRRASQNRGGARGPELSHSGPSKGTPKPGSAIATKQPRSREFSREVSSSTSRNTTGPSSPGYDTRRLGGSDLRRLTNSFEFESWVDSLVEEGYDLSDYTWEEMFDIYLDEAAKRTPKKTRGAKDPVAYMKGRSDAGKRISGDEDTGPRYYTLGRARGAEADAPTQPGQKPVRTPKLAGWEKDDIQYRKANLKAGKTHKVGGEKGLPEEYEIYEIVSSYLLENNFAETLNDANVIIENMSEAWLDQILSEEN